jgi:hypothetical protein
MINWTKEEIMAYADGQLENSSIERIQDAISKDPKAKDFYESMIYSGDVIKDTMQQLESGLKVDPKSYSQNNYEKNNKQFKASKLKSAARSISIKSIFIPALIGLSLFASIGYFIGQNTHQQLLMRGGETQDFDKYRDELENFLNLGTDGDIYTINENKPNQAIFTIINTNFSEDICRKVKFENAKYIQTFYACKDIETWSFQLSD